MKRSTERILTTHTGSLPRPPDLTAMLESMDAGGALDAAAFDGGVRRAVADIVRQQVDVGVDIVNDGEQGKVGYSTYVRHRLTGFGGQSAVPARADWADFPEAAVMNASVGFTPARAALKLATSFCTAVRSFHSIGPSHDGREIVERRSDRAAASGKSAQSARTGTAAWPPKPVSRCRT